MTHAQPLKFKEALHFLHLGDALFRSNKWEAATEAFLRAKQLDPHIPEINYLIGYAYQTQSQFEKAREYYEQQLASTPDHLESLVHLGAIDVEQKRFPDAEKSLNQVLLRDPDHVEANFELGLMAFKTNQLDRAIERFNRVLWLRPDHTQAEYYLYLALSRTDKDELARAALATWKKLEALDRMVRSEEVAFDAARQARWEVGKSSQN